MPDQLQKPSAQAETDTAPARAWHHIFLMVSGFLVVFMVGLVVFMGRSGRTRDAWTDAMRGNLAKQGSGFDAMAPVLEALDQTDWRALESNRRELEEVAGTGWSRNPAVEKLVVSHQPVIAMVGRSAAIPHASFPSLLEYEVDRPLPQFDRFRLLSQLLIANARRLEAEKSPAEALQRLVELGTLGSRFARPPGEASYTSHGLAITLIEQAVGVSGEVVRSSPQLPPEVLLRVDLQLEELEAKYIPLRAAVYDELDLFEHMARNRVSSPDDLAVVLQFYDTKLDRNAAATEAKELYGLVPSLGMEMEHLKPLLDAALNRPENIRPVFDDAMLGTMSTNPLALLPLRPVGALSMREEVMIARLRMTRALCRLLADPKAPITIVDPFSGAPFVHTGTAIVSVGPDRSLENGARLYNPQNGLSSGGDLVLTVEHRQSNRQSPDDVPPRAPQGGP